jgi:hypothetical protein
MRLTTGRAKIKQSFENLGIRWEDTRAGWDDAARRAFEQEHIEPLAPDVQGALRAIDRLSAILYQMESDCS